MTASESADVSELPPRSICVLDPDSDWLLFLFEYFSKAGFHVTASSTLEETLSLISSAPADVLIADQGVSGVNEIDLVARVKLVSPATRIILTTPRSVVLPGLRWLRSEGLDLIVKPIDWGILMRAVERNLWDRRVKRAQTSR